VTAVSTKRSLTTSAKAWIWAGSPKMGASGSLSDLVDAWLRSSPLFWVGV